jgi:hypothetical protein
MVSLDIVGPFPNGCYILTIIDIFSRHLELYILNSITANAVADKFLQYISTHGRPSQVLSDLGTQFNSRIFYIINRTLQINILYASTGRPQANSISERINFSIKSCIAALKLEGYAFHHAVQLHKAVYNATEHPSTGFSPNQVHFARDLSIFNDTLNLQEKPDHATPLFKLHQIFQALEAIHSKVQDNLRYSQQCNAEKQTNFKKMRNFNPGDIVYIKGIKAFHQKLDGPFKILEQTSQVTYKLQRLGNTLARKFTIHVDRLVLSHKRPKHLVENKQTSSSDQVSNTDSLQVPVSSFRLPQTLHVDPDLSSDDEDVALSSSESAAREQPSPSDVVIPSSDPTTQEDDLLPTSSCEPLPMIHDTSRASPELEKCADSSFTAGPEGSSSNQCSTLCPSESHVDQSPTSSNSHGSISSISPPVLSSPLSCSNHSSSRSLPSLSPVPDVPSQSFSAVTTDSNMVTTKTHRRSKTTIGENVSSVRQLRSANKQEGRYNLRKRTKLKCICGGN